MSKETPQNIETEPLPVAKADTTLDASEVLADPAKGDPTEGADEPGSPAWEAVDAATARKWTAILARSKNALSLMAEREGLEVAVGAGGDSEMDAAFSLEDASCAIDYAISQLAPFAVDEQTEVDTAVDAVAKAMQKASTDDLDVIESLGPVRKAGRVLSASNEAAIRGAVDSLQKVLASLPAAPEDVSKSKEAPAVKNGPTLVVKIKPELDEEALAELKDKVSKAKGDPMVPVYDAQGNLCGMVAADDVVPIAAAPAPTGAATAPPNQDAEAAQAADAATPVDGTQTAPVAANGGVPVPDATQNQAPVVKAETSQDIAELVRTQVAEQVKAASQDHERVVKDLKDRLERVEAQPAPGGPLLSGLAQGGLTPTSGGHVALRGQEPPTETPEIVRIRKALEETKDPVKQAQLRRELSFHQVRSVLGGK